MTDYDAAVAERRQLVAEINRLQSRIETELVNYEMLQRELKYVIAQLGVLNTAAQGMSMKVTADVGRLSDKMGHEDLDARDLLQLLRDVSERYFAYENLYTAT